MIKCVRIKRGTSEVVSVTFEESSHQVDYKPLCAFIYDSMVRDGVIKMPYQVKETLP